MKVSVYKNMTLHIFHSINIIKQIHMIELDSTQEVEFTFKKKGFKKLLIFDLDETLIHCQREELIEEANGEDNEFRFVPDIFIDIQSPSSGELVKTGFTIRPFALDCLKIAN